MSSKFARVHVFATRYLPEYDAYGHLSKVRRGTVPVLAHARRIGVLDGPQHRRRVPLHHRPQVRHQVPGNMLERPSLLLNPWAVRDTETGEQARGSGW